MEAVHYRQACTAKLAQSAQLICLRGPLAFLCSRAVLAPANERQDLAQAALHAKHDAKALAPLSICSARPPCTPVLMPAGSLPKPPGSGVTSPARRNRTRSINWQSPVDVPDVSETARLWSSRRRSQRLCICADESRPFALRGFRQLARTALDSFGILSSLPDLIRPSTSCFRDQKDVDARHKAGHDGRCVFRHCRKRRAGPS